MRPSVRRDPATGQMESLVVASVRVRRMGERECSSTKVMIVGRRGFRPGNRIGQLGASFKGQRDRELTSDWTGEDAEGRVSQTARDE